MLGRKKYTDNEIRGMEFREPYGNRQAQWIYGMDLIADYGDGKIQDEYILLDCRGVYGDAKNADNESMEGDLLAVCGNRRIDNASGF